MFPFLVFSKTEIDVFLTVNQQQNCLNVTLSPKLFIMEFESYSTIFSALNVFSKYFIILEIFTAKVTPKHATNQGIFGVKYNIFMPQNGIQVHLVFVLTCMFVCGKKL